MEFGIINKEQTACAVCSNTIEKGDRIYAGGEWEDNCLCNVCWERPQHDCFMSCYLVDGLCPNCDDDDEDEAEEPTYDIRTTVIDGIVCKQCNHKLQPMTIKDHLEGNFNQVCPHD